MKRTPARFVSLAAGVVGLLGFLCGASGHQNPLGDIDARVSVEGDVFVVKGWDPQKSKNEDYAVIKKVFDAKGNLREEKRELMRGARAIFFPKYSFLGQLREEENGLEREWNGATLIVPESERKHGGRPSVILNRGGEFFRHKLAWKKAGVYAVEDALVEGNDLYLLVTRLSPARQAELSLHRFSLKTWAEEAQVDLPKAEVIYSPICSNLIAEQGKVYVGIVSPLGDGQVLYLAGWDGRSAQCSVRELTKRIDGNTSLSLAHIGDDALMAYHHPENGFSRIQAIAFSLD